MSPLGNLRILGRLMRHRDYRVYSITNGLSLIGTWMQRVSIGWLTWELTGSGAWLGLMAFADLFPTLIVGAFAGAAADRWRILPLMRVTQCLGMAQAAVLAILHMLGLLDIWMLFGLAVLQGAFAAFGQPARLTVVSSLVPRADIGAAVAMNALIFNLARFIGPACAGIIIAAGGVGWAYVANALSYLPFVWALFVITPPPMRRARPTTSFLSDIAEGFVHAAGRPGIRAVMLMTVGVGLFGRPVVELLPGFASGIFSAGAGGLAALTSAVGVGSMLGGAWMVGRASAPHLARAYFAIVVAAGIAVIVFAASPTFYIALPMAGVVGFCLISAGIAGQTLVQLSAEEAVRGRLLSIFGLLQKGMPALGALAVGTASELAGLRLSVASAAVLLSAFGATLLIFGRRAAALLDAAVDARRDRKD